MAAEAADSAAAFQYGVAEAIDAVSQLSGVDGSYAGVGDSESHSLLSAVASTVGALATAQADSVATQRLLPGLDRIRRVVVEAQRLDGADRRDLLVSSDLMASLSDLGDEAEAIHHESMATQAIEVGRLAVLDSELRVLVPLVLFLTIAVGGVLRLLFRNAKRAERREERAEDRDRLKASFAHGLRTPLTSVVGFSWEMADNLGGFESDEISDMARTVAEQSSEAALIVENILVGIRTDSGDITLLRRELDVATEIEFVVGVLSEAAQRRITLSGEATAIADSQRFRQVVHNLLVNAIQHGGENVEIRVDQAELVHVIIADDGKGLPDNWTTVGADTALPVDTIPHRIGLGISVAQSLIELMGGGMEYRRADGWAGWELTVPASPAPREPFGYTHEVAGTATG